MDRRNFLKSFGAASLLPSLPLKSIAAVTPATPAAAAPLFSNHTYQWAEMIVRAHNKCNLGLLQRSLRIDAGAAEALRRSLIKNGIVTAQANAYGIHTATKPLYEGAFMNVSETGKQLVESMEKVSDFLDQESEDTPVNDSDTNNLDENTESSSECVGEAGTDETRAPNTATGSEEPPEETL